jgi:hypothetical protein
MVNTRPAIFFLFFIFCTAAVASAENDSSSAAAPSHVGLVRDELGQPLGGATVSVFGKSLSRGALTAITDEQGRFTLSGIPPGLYRLRAYLSGFFPSAFARVVVEEGAERVGTILMSLTRLDSGLTEEGYVEETGEARTVSELRWVVQRQERNILKENESFVPVDDANQWEESPGFDPALAL